MNRQLLHILSAALFAALVATGAYLAIPLEPPVVLANFFALLAGLVLGPVWSAVSMLVYLVLGALGLPVFAGGKGGIGILMGPTGGFLAGYLAMAVLAGLIARSPTAGNSPVKPGFLAVLRLSLASFAGIVVLYLIGLARFQAVLSDKFNTLPAAFFYMLPWLAGDLVKAVAAILVALGVRPVLASWGFGRDRQPA